MAVRAVIAVTPGSFVMSGAIGTRRAAAANAAP